MAGIVMAAPLKLPGTHRQEGLGAVEGLDLRFLVDTQHHGALGRGQVEADDVAYLLDKQRVGRELEALGAVWLQTESLPDAMDGRWCMAHRRRHRAQRPMRRIGRGRLQGQADRLGDLRIPDLSRRAWAGLIMKTLNTALGKAPAPFANGVLVSPNRAGDHLIFQARSGGQHNPRAARQALRGPTTARQSLQLGSLRSRQLDCNRRFAHRSYPQIRMGMISRIYRSGH